MTRLSSGYELVLLSDVHLNEIIAPSSDAPGWWQYKHREAAQDHDLVRFLEAVEARRPSHFRGTQVIFNGDTFDFDLVYSAPPGVKRGKEGLPPTAPASVYKILRIFSDHPEFVRGLAAFLSRGNRALFVMGNHDRELCFDEVQEVIRTRLARAAPPGTGQAVARAVGFEPWFVYRPGVLFCEHGQQYDATCSYRDVLDPTVPPDRSRGREVETPMGSIMGRHILCRMGSFNPYNDESFLMSFGGYMRHMREHYWPGRSFFGAYINATWRAVRELRLRRRRVPRSARRLTEDPRYQRYGARHGVGPGFIATLLRLSSPPIIDRMRLVFHELWLDRLFIVLAAIAIIVAGVNLVQTWTQGLMMLTLLPAFVWVMRLMGRGSLALEERSRWGLVAEQIAEGAAVPIVAFGHSHRPERRPLSGGGRYYNLGTWAPVVTSDRGSTLWRARRFLIVREDAMGRAHTVFGRWDRDQLEVRGG